MDSRTVKAQMDDDDCSTQNGAAPKKDYDITIDNGQVPQKSCFNIFEGVDDDSNSVEDEDQDNDNDDDDDIETDSGAVPKKDDNILTNSGSVPKAGKDMLTDRETVPKKEEDVFTYDGTVPNKSNSDNLERTEDDKKMTYNGTVPKKDEDIRPSVSAVPQKSYFNFIATCNDAMPMKSNLDILLDESNATYNGTKKSNLDIDFLSGESNATYNGTRKSNLDSLEQMEDEDIATYDGIALKRSDLRSLQGVNYISDNIIGFYFSYLSSTFPSRDIFLVSPSVSFLLATLSPFDETYKTLVEILKLPEKQLLIFTVNDGLGIHWSLLVYHRASNTFIHHDSIKGQHRSNAHNFYNTIKQFVGRSIPSSLSGSTSSDAVTILIKKRKKMIKKYTATGIYQWKLACMSSILKAEYLARDDGPLFKDECFTPQQSNCYDCGLYVMAIARVICEWYLNEPRNRDELWFSDLERKVDPTSVELGMRGEVLKLIEDLRNGTLGQPPG